MIKTKYVKISCNIKKKKKIETNWCENFQEEQTHMLSDILRRQFQNHLANYNLLSVIISFLFFFVITKYICRNIDFFWCNITKKITIVLIYSNSLKDIDFQFCFFFLIIYIFSYIKIKYIRNREETIFQQSR